MTDLWIYIIVFIFTVLAYLLRTLTFSGAVAAGIVGGAVTLGFGWKGLFILGLFFLSSNIWSKFKRQRKQKAEQKHEKGSRRDWQQVVANGGVAAVFSLLYFSLDHQVWLIAFCVAIASANSDTWASEVGTLSKRHPLFIRTFKRIESGTSGAISALGTFASLAGAFLIAAFSGILFSLDVAAAVFVLLFGFVGNVVDTILGAYVQAAYRCPVCGSEIEKKTHCQRPAVRIRGISVMDNDLVNLVSGLLAAVAGCFVYLLYF